MLGKIPVWIIRHIYFACAYNVSVNLGFSYLILSFFLSDILFGIPWKNSGIARYFIRNQQRTISFAITIAMKTYDQRWFCLFVIKTLGALPLPGKTGTVSITERANKYMELCWRGIDNGQHYLETVFREIVTWWGFFYISIKIILGEGILKPWIFLSGDKF